MRETHYHYAISPGCYIRVELIPQHSQCCMQSRYTYSTTDGVGVEPTRLIARWFSKPVQSPICLPILYLQTTGEWRLRSSATCYGRPLISNQVRYRTPSTLPRKQIFVRNRTYFSPMAGVS